MGDQIEMSTAENIFGSVFQCFKLAKCIETHIFVQYWSCGSNT